MLSFTRKNITNLPFRGPCSLYMRIPFDILRKRCNITQFTYFWETALHISGGVSTHHQEHTQLYLQYLVLVKPLLLPTAIVEEFELI